MTAAVLLVGALVTAGSAFALVTAGSAFALSEADTSSGTLHRGPFEVALTGGNGESIRGEHFDVTGAMPGMPAAQASVRIANTGNEPAHYRISITDLQAQGAHSLDEVLEVTMRQQPSGDVVYRGRLSTLSVDNSVALLPDQAAVYEVSIAWPDTAADDNPYQNATLGFALEVAATQA